MARDWVVCLKLKLERQLDPARAANEDEDSKGNLWAGVENGLWRWKAAGPPKFYAIPGEPNGVQALREDGDSALLVGWKGRIR